MRAFPSAASGRKAGTTSAPSGSSTKCARISRRITRQYDLSLNSLSVRFGITGNYLSSLFKKQKGVNFSAYLEEVRIGHAETMLRSHEGTIDEIAQKPAIPTRIPSGARSGACAA